MIRCAAALAPITAFVTGNRQLGRLSSIGGAFNLRDSSSTDNVVGGDSRSIRLTVHGSHRFAVGTTRLQLLLADLENGPNHGSGSGITWDQSWEISRAINAFQHSRFRDGKWHRQ